MNISQHRNFLLSEITIANPTESFGIDKDGKRIVFKVDERGVVNAINLDLVKLEIKDKKIKALYCYGNKLTTLNLKGLTNLEQLYCFSNQITSLNVKGLTKLKELSYDNNQVKLIK